MLKFWKQNKFKCLAIASILFLISVSICKHIAGTRGTYTRDVDFLYATEMDDVIYLPQKKFRVARESRGETECRRVLEKIFKAPFPNVRPAWLNNSVTGRALELDCYNESLNIAVEYNGRQHYEYIPAFHHTRDAYYNQQYRDERKKELCAQNGTYLVVVPYTVAVDAIENYLVDRLRGIGALRS